MKLLFSLFWQEWQSHWKKYSFFSACLSLGIGGICGVSSFNSDVKSALTMNASILLGGDLEITDVKPINSEILNWTIQNKQVSKWALVNRLTAMASLNEKETKLVEVVAFSGSFPLFTKSIRTAAGVNPSSLVSGQAMVDSGLLDAWNLKVGERLSISGKSYTIRERVEEDLGRELGPFAFGPRVYIQRSDALDQGLLGNTSRFKESLLLNTDFAKSLKQDLKSVFKGTKSDSLRFAEPNDESRSSNRTLKNLNLFLSQVALSTLVLIGLGVSTCLAEIIRQKIPSIGIYRALGASPQLPSQMLLCVLASVCFFGVIGGLILGELLRSLVFSPQLKGLFPVPLSGFSLRNMPFLLPLFSFSIPLVFLWPYLRSLERISPSGVLRGFHDVSLKIRNSDYLIWAGALVALLGLFVLTSGNTTAGLALFAANLALFMCFRFIMNALLWLGTSKKLQKSTALEIALAEISSRKLTSMLSMALLGIGLFVFATVSFLKSDLLSSLKEDASQSEKPNLYFIDVQKSQQQDLSAYLKQNTEGNIEQAPMMRARLSQIDSIDVSDTVNSESRDSQATQREQNLTWKFKLGRSESIESSSEALNQGEIWISGSTNQVSLESRFAQRIGAKLGSNLTFLISGVSVSAKVTSLRKVNWQSLRPNFFVVLHPDLMADAPHQVLMSAFVKSPSQRAKLQAEIVKKFPNVSILDGTKILERVEQLSQGSVKIIELLSALLTAAALLILTASLVSTRQARRKNTAILRAMGANSKLITKAIFFEFAMLGAVSGLLGVGMAQLVGQILSRSVFDLEPTLHFASPAFMWLGTIGLTLMVGYASCRSVLSIKPAQVFREN
jgi:putative ABC transport system permease protein